MAAASAALFRVLFSAILKNNFKNDSPSARLGDYFDLIAGSSTGGLIAYIILYPNEKGSARFSIQKGLELYSDWWCVPLRRKTTVFPGMFSRWYFYLPPVKLLV